MLSKKKFLTDTFFYGISIIFNKILAVLTLPLLTFFINQSELGIFDFFNYLLLFFGILVVFGQDSALGRYLHECQNDREKKALISQSLLFQIIIILIFICTTWIILKDRIGNESNNDILLLLILLQLPAFFFINFTLNLLKWSFRRNAYLILSILNSSLSFLFLIITFKFISSDLIFVFLSLLISRYILSLFAVYLIYNWIFFTIKLDYLRKLLPYALPFGVICTIGAFIPIFERSLIIKYLGDNDLGLYAICFKVALFISLPTEAFKTAWAPYALAMYKKGNFTSTYNLILKYFSFIMIPLIFLLTFISYPIADLLVFNKYFSQEEIFIIVSIVFTLSTCIMLESINSITEIGIILSKKTYLKLISYLIFLISLILILQFMIINYGLIGLTWGTVICYFIKLVSNYIIAQIIFPIEWKVKNIFIFIFSSILFGFIIQYSYQYIFNVLYLPSYLIFGLIFVLGIWLLFIKNDEKQLIISEFNLIKKNIFKI